MYKICIKKYIQTLYINEESKKKKQLKLHIFSVDINIFFSRVCRICRRKRPEIWEREKKLINILRFIYKSARWIFLHFHPYIDDLLQVSFIFLKAPIPSA